MSRACFAALVAVLLCCLVSAEASAQNEPIDTQRFRPHVTSDGFLSQEGSGVRNPVDPWSFGLWLHYGHNPLVIATDEELRRELVGTQFAFDLTASYAIATWFELGLGVPLAYLSGEDLSQLGLGDLRVVPKFNFLDDRLDGIGLGLTAEVRLPTHTGDYYGGARNVIFAPRLLVDHRMGGLRLGGSLGATLREKTQFLNVAAGSELNVGLALAYRFDQGFSPFEVVGDLQSGIGLSEADAEEIALEALAALRIHASPEWSFNVGGGLGVLEGYGTPTFRLLASVRWEPSPNDPDRDDVATDPYAQEGADTDGDGQPDDFDGDGQPDDARDRAVERGYDGCPDMPEDLDGVEDDDGCPEGDEDGDGVLDYYDRCPDEEEVINGFEDDDGCADEGPARVIVEDGRLKVLETIRFQPNSNELEPESEPILNQIALTLRKRQDISHVRIDGYTDNTGSRELNETLSYRRAQAVRQRLMEYGISGSRLSAQGLGPANPVADNATEEGRALNRRVEFIIVR